MNETYHNDFCREARFHPTALTAGWRYTVLVGTKRLHAADTAELYRLYVAARKKRDHATRLG